MNPYLEARWSDVHVSLLFLIKEALTFVLPDSLRARSEEQILVEESDGVPLRQYRADIAMVQARRKAPNPRREAGGTATVPEPFVVEFLDGPQVDRFIKIIDVKNGNRLVTAIELLSPWNKGSGRLNEDYLRKLDDYTKAGVSVVEIDLLQSSRARLKVTEMDLPPEGRTPYLICVQKGWRPGRWEAYAVDLRVPVPPIRVPLRRSDREVVLKMQPLLDRVYVAGGYNDIDYSKPPVPGFRKVDEAWADELLRKAKLRKGGKRRRRS